MATPINHDAADVTVATLACTPLVVWRSPSFLCLALGDAVLIVIDVFAIAYAPKHVSGSECALVCVEIKFQAPRHRRDTCSMAWLCTRHTG